MTSLGTTKAVRDFSKLWVTLGLSALGPIMTVGRVPVEIAVRTVRRGLDRAAS
jgi:hypothetical protein